MATSAPAARAEALPSPWPPFNLQPPSHLGRLTDTFRADNPSAPWVILIQDLHAHYGVQKNIAGLLQFLSDRLNAGTGTLPFGLAVEGAAGPVDNSVLTQYPDGAVRAAATDYLLREAEITGADAFAVRRGLPHAIVGVENPAFYQVNRTLFRQSLTGRTALAAALEGIAADLAALSRSVYPRELKAFEWAHAQQPDYAGELRMAQGQARDLVRVRHDVDLLRRVANLQATEAEVREFAPRLKEFMALARTLVAGSGRRPAGAIDAVRLRSLISASIDYYVMAMARNAPMVDNTLALTSATRPAVLIAGGFHTAPLTQLLRERHVNYVVLTPAVDRLTDADRALYLKRLSGNYLSEDDMLTAARQRSRHFRMALGEREPAMDRLARWFRPSSAPDSLAVGRDALFNQRAAIALLLSGAVLTGAFAHGAIDPRYLERLAKAAGWARLAGVPWALDWLRVHAMSSGTTLNGKQRTRTGYGYSDLVNEVNATAVDDIRYQLAPTIDAPASIGFWWTLFHARNLHAAVRAGQLSLTAERWALAGLSVLTAAFPPLALLIVAFLVLHVALFAATRKDLGGVLRGRDLAQSWAILAAYAMPAFFHDTDVVWGLIIAGLVVAPVLWELHGRVDRAAFRQLNDQPTILLVCKANLRSSALAEEVRVALKAAGRSPIAVESAGIYPYTADGGKDIIESLEQAINRSPSRLRLVKALLHPTDKKEYLHRTGHREETLPTYDIRTFYTGQYLRHAPSLLGDEAKHLKGRLVDLADLVQETEARVERHAVEQFKRTFAESRPDLRAQVEAVDVTMLTASAVRRAMRIYAANESIRENIIREFPGADKKTEVANLLDDREGQASFDAEMTQLYTGLYREIVAPAQPAGVRQAVYPASGGNIGALLLSTNAERSILIDQRAFGFNAAWTYPGTENEARQRYFEDVHYTSFPTSDDMGIYGSPWFILKWELQSLGVPGTAIQVEQTVPGLWRLQFPWTHPGETKPRLRTVYFLEKTPLAITVFKEVNTTLNAAGVRLQNTDVLFEKASDDAHAAIHEAVPFIKTGGLWITDNPHVTNAEQEAQRLESLKLPQSVAARAHRYGRASDSPLVGPSVPLRVFQKLSVKDINLAAGAPGRTVSHGFANTVVARGVSLELRGDDIDSRRAALETNGVKTVADYLNITPQRGTVNPPVIPVTDLIKRTGQLAHIGLGRTYGIPVIYVDAHYVQYGDLHPELLNDLAQVLHHEWSEIRFWESIRHRLGRNPEEMRAWILAHLRLAYVLAWLGHSWAPSVNQALKNADFTFREHIARIPVDAYTPDNEGPNLAAVGRMDSNEGQTQQTLEKAWERLLDLPLYHGTSTNNLDSIQRYGLSRDNKPFDRADFDFYSHLYERLFGHANPLAYNYQTNVLNATSDFGNARDFASRGPEVIHQLVTRSDEYILSEPNVRSRLTKEELRRLEGIREKYKAWQSTHRPLVLMFHLRDLQVEERPRGFDTAENFEALYKRFRAQLGATPEEFIASLPNLIRHQFNDIRFSSVASDRLSMIDAAGAALPVTENHGSSEVFDRATKGALFTPVTADVLKSLNPHRRVHVTVTDIHRRTTRLFLSVNALAAHIAHGGSTLYSINLDGIEPKVVRPKPADNPKLSEAIRGADPSQIASYWVRLASGEMVSFTGNLDMISEIAASPHVVSVEFPEYERVALRTYNDVPDRERRADYDWQAALASRLLPSATVDSRMTDIAGMVVQHGTLRSFEPSVRSGPLNLGKGFGGRGLYLSVPGEEATARYFAERAQSNAASHLAHTSEAAADVAQGNRSIILQGTIKKEKPYRVGVFAIKQHTGTDLSKGILDFDWDKNPNLRQFMESQFDVLDLRGLRSTGLAIGSDRILVVHERAGRDVIAWDAQEVPLTEKNELYTLNPDREAFRREQDSRKAALAKKERDDAFVDREFAAFQAHKEVARPLSRVLGSRDNLSDLMDQFLAFFRQLSFNGETRWTFERIQNNQQDFENGLSGLREDLKVLTSADAVARDQYLGWVQQRLNERRDYLQQRIPSAGGTAIRKWWYAIPFAGLETARLFWLLHHNAAGWHFNPVVLAAVTLLTFVAMHLPQYLVKKNGERTSVMETKPFWLVAGAEVLAILLAPLVSPFAATLLIAGAIVFHYTINVLVFRLANPWVDRHYLARQRGLGFLAKLPGGKAVVGPDDVADTAPLAEASAMLAPRQLVDLQTAFERASRDAFRIAA